MKNHKIPNRSTTTESREKNEHRFEILIVLWIFWCMTKYKKQSEIIAKLATDF